MVTPFDENGRLDLDVTAKLARWLVANGNDFLVVAGTTGESPTLTDLERIDLVRAVCEAVTVPVIAGAGTNDTLHSVEMTKESEAAGAAAILAVTPYYNRPPQAGIEAHMRAIAAATDLPVMLYDIPIRTGRKISHDVLVRLSEVTNIVALKDAALNVSATAKLVAAAPGLELYSGNDDQTLCLAALGAVGTVGVCTHWAARQVGALLNAFWKGDHVDARRWNDTLLPSYDFEGSDLTPNPIPAKAAMRFLGFSVGQCRLPLGDAPDGLDAAAAALIASLGALT